MEAIKIDKKELARQKALERHRRYNQEHRERLTTLNKALYEKQREQRILYQREYRLKKKQTVE